MSISAEQGLIGSGTPKADSIQSLIPLSKSPNPTTQSSTTLHQSLQSSTIPRASLLELHWRMEKRNTPMLSSLMPIWSGLIITYLRALRR